MEVRAKGRRARVEKWARKKLPSANRQRRKRSDAEDNLLGGSFTRIKSNT
ncbi:hypothetical protein HPP92_007530 [Vanilla planifolia]|uniref:Uncharacterized protein n=1 Tax=Vanilla planifolia TaxID=51239 RepID=A0A835RMK5_VANPL|nr:hypothetical protein HPP92_007754 [Vanilla planifolia]KAG0490667.1 hypothetical protein HPP92_007530 [Vanilla planifolia]